MAAHGSKQDGIAVFCRFQGLLCQRYAVFVNGNAAHIHFCVMERMAEDLAHPVQNLFGLCDDLRPDAVAGDHCDPVFHKIFLRLFPVMSFILSHSPGLFNGSTRFRVYIFVMASITDGQKRSADPAGRASSFICLPPGPAYSLYSSGLRSRNNPQERRSSARGSRSKEAVITPSESRSMDVTSSPVPSVIKEEP